MSEIMNTEDMEHINADRDIALLMQKKAQEEQQKVDDSIKAEAAKYAMHMRRVRSIAHIVSHIMLVCTGAGLAAAVFMLIESDIWAFARAVISVGLTMSLARVFNDMSKKRKD